MGKCFFGYPDWGVHSPDPVLSGGSWESTLPLTNVFDTDLSKVARTQDAAAASSVIDIDLGSTNKKRIQALGIFNHNIDTSGTIRIRIGTVADMTSGVQYDSGTINIHDNVHPDNMPRWEAAAQQDNDIDSDEFLDRGYHVPFIWFNPTNPSLPYRYVKIEIVNTGNNDGYIQIGRVVPVSGFQPDINFQPGAALGWETNSESIETDGGQFFHIERRRRRVFTFTLPEATDDEVLVHQWRLMQKLGTTGQLLFIYDVDDTVHMHRRAFLATFRGLSPMGISWGGRINIPMSLVEEI